MSDLSAIVLGGRFRFHSILGQGSDGTVYAAIDLQTGGPVAIKVYHALSGKSPEQVQEHIAAEARISSDIPSPYLVKTLTYGVAPAAGGVLTGYLVMEYLSGMTLRDHLAQTQRLDLVEIVRVLMLVLNALNSLHQARTVHLDVKPSNVFLLDQAAVSAGRPAVKLLDFGAARSPDRMHGVVRGTPFFAAPELVTGHAPIGPAADLYSCGIMLFEMLVGEAPIPAGDTQQILAHHVHGKLAPLPPPYNTHEIAQIYQNATAVDVAQRYRSAADMARALQGMKLFSQFSRNEARSSLEIRSITQPGVLPTQSAFAAPTSEDSVVARLPVGGMFVAPSEQAQPSTSYGLSLDAPDHIPEARVVPAQHALHTRGSDDGFSAPPRLPGGGAFQRVSVREEDTTLEGAQSPPQFAARPAAATPPRGSRVAKGAAVALTREIETPTMGSVNERGLPGGFGVNIIEESGEFDTVGHSTDVKKRPQPVPADEMRTMSRDVNSATTGSYATPLPFAIGKSDPTDSPLDVLGEFGPDTSSSKKTQAFEPPASGKTGASLEDNPFNLLGEFGADIDGPAPQAAAGTAPTKASVKPSVKATVQAPKVDPDDPFNLLGEFGADISGPAPDPNRQTKPALLGGEPPDKKSSDAKAADTPPPEGGAFGDADDPFDLLSEFGADIAGPPPTGPKRSQAQIDLAATRPGVPKPDLSKLIAANDKAGAKKPSVAKPKVVAKPERPTVTTPRLPKSTAQAPPALAQIQPTEMAAGAPNSPDIAEDPFDLLGEFGADSDGPAPSSLAAEPTPEPTSKPGPTPAVDTGVKEPPATAVSDDDDEDDLFADLGGWDVFGDDDDSLI